MTEKGLMEIIAAQTAISDIDGDEGRLWYAGYDIADLAERSTFVETAYLLIYGSLPKTEEYTRRILSLPMHPMLTEDEVHRVASAVKAYLK